MLVYPGIHIKMCGYKEYNLDGVNAPVKGATVYNIVRV